MRGLTDQQILKLLPKNSFTSHEAQKLFGHKNRKTTRARLMDLVHQGLLLKLVNNRYMIPGKDEIHTSDEGTCFSWKDECQSAWQKAENRKVTDEIIIGICNNGLAYSPEAEYCTYFVNRLRYCLKQIKQLLENSK